MPRLWTYRALAILLAVVVALGGAELILRLYGRWLERSASLDRGMLQYDADLGWKLTPGWTGRHEHADFKTTYAIGGDGFRQDRSVDLHGPGPRTVVLGDSFTFGLGVD